MPIHAGHIALIEFAASRCDELIVSMSYTDLDPIPFAKRFEWIKEIFCSHKNIHPRLIADDFDEPHLDVNERTEGWAKVISKVYPKIDLVFSSESYGEPFADHLGAVHVAFDPERERVPISASAIRAKPFTHWDYIPQVARPYFVKKICFYGAESTGKSTMAEKMAKRYNTIFVPEVAREMITTNDFTLDDIARIGVAHHERILERIKDANKILFCDTDAITTRIYSYHYLKAIPTVLEDLDVQMTYDKYFLFDIDVPWVADGLRDLGHEREKMHALFLNELQKRKINYTLVCGDWEQREKIITDEIDRLLRDA
jgi:HTH-type transcriptional regulator, transcriptional repressor of NAD biosynthesis genes